MNHKAESLTCSWSAAVCVLVHIHVGVDGGGRVVLMTTVLHAKQHDDPIGSRILLSAAVTILIIVILHRPD